MTYHPLEGTPMKNLISLCITSLTLLALPAAYATDSQPSVKATAESASASAASTLEMTDGEVKKVDKGTKKITLKHSAIKNLDMPGMTMLFRVKDPAMLEQVQAGDKIQFLVERINGALVLTEIHVVK
jgi:Cu(I)/Ag(I) efflux system protein CusF